MEFWRALKEKRGKKGKEGGKKEQEKVSTRESNPQLSDLQCIPRACYEVYPDTKVILFSLVVHCIIVAVKISVGPAVYPSINKIFHGFCATVKLKYQRN